MFAVVSFVNIRISNKWILNLPFPRVVNSEWFPDDAVPDWKLKYLTLAWPIFNPLGAAPAVEIFVSCKSITPKGAIVEVSVPNSGWPEQLLSS